MLHVPYKGTAPALMDVVTGQIEIMFADLGLAQVHARSGRLRLLGVSTSKRSAAAPEVPTIAESLPGYEVSPWFGLVGPAGVPKDIVNRLNQTIAAALQSPDAARSSRERWLTTRSPTVPSLRCDDQVRYRQYGNLIRSAGIKVAL